MRGGAGRIEFFHGKATSRSFQAIAAPGSTISIRRSYAGVAAARTSGTARGMPHRPGRAGPREARRTSRTPPMRSVDLAIAEKAYFVFNRGWLMLPTDATRVDASPSAVARSTISIPNTS